MGDITITVALGRPYSDLVRDFKRSLIEQALASTGGDVGRTARILGMASQNLYRLMGELGLRATRNNQSDGATWNHQSDGCTADHQGRRQ